MYWFILPIPIPISTIPKPIPIPIILFGFIPNRYRYRFVKPIPIPIIGISIGIGYTDLADYRSIPILKELSSQRKQKKMDFWNMVNYLQYEQAKLNDKYDKLLEIVKQLRTKRLREWKSRRSLSK